MNRDNRKLKITQVFNTYPTFYQPFNQTLVDSFAGDKNFDLI